MYPNPSTRELHERLGRVYHQPVTVHSYTNKRITVNYRAPIEQIQRLLPTVVAADEIDSTGLAMISMCACDFWVKKFGPVPIPAIHTNEMLCRISVKVRKAGRSYRAYYTLRSDSSSRLLGLLGGYFSHFRKAVSQFTRTDDGSTYALKCRSVDPICGGRLAARTESLSKVRPDTTIFEDINAATRFIYDVDGSCGYSYRQNKLSLQLLEQPEWNIYFCHDFECQFNLIDYLFDAFQIDGVLDSALYVERTGHAWRACWLYEPESVMRDGTASAHAA